MITNEIMILGGLALIGLAMLVIASPFHKLLDRWHARRLAARHMRGTDAWADELRSLGIYTPARLRLIFGGFGMVLISPAASALIQTSVRTLSAGQ